MYQKPLRIARVIIESAFLKRYIVKVLTKLTKYLTNKHLPLICHLYCPSNIVRSCAICVSVKFFPQLILPEMVLKISINKKKYIFEAETTKGLD